MTKSLSELTVFRIAEGSPLSLVCTALSEQKNALATSILIENAVRFGWQGNIFHCLLAHTLISSENPFSLLCERRRAHRDSLYEYALRDCAVFRELFKISLPDKGLESFSCLQAQDIQGGKVTALLARELADAISDEAFAEIIAAHYEKHGVGMLGMNQSFLVRDENDFPLLIPVVSKADDASFSALVGYDEQKKQLIANTEAFICGKSANNVLLYGDAGTGKSTSIHALLPEFSERGLRIIELNRNQFRLIPRLFEQIKGRNYRFILFLDDLSFEDSEIEYKALKSVLEGGASAMPENIRVYATSNRRNLVRESWKDRSDMEHDGDIHRSDTMEEKLSLSSRFGLRIFYPAPTFDEYQEIVAFLASRSDGCKLSKDELKSAAATWQVRSGSRSGRTARQFIDSLSSDK